jgi:hypothetical protein
MVRVTPLRSALHVAAACGASAVMADISAAQCRPPASSNEARLLAYYSAPVVMSPQLVPPGVGDAWVRLGGDVTYVPRPDPTLQRSGRCFMPKEESTHLTSILPRPRIVATLPHGLMLEASYLPPIQVAHAKANLLSGAASISRGVGVWLGGPLVGTARAHFTHGTIHGSITCPKKALQQIDASVPCYGTDPSYDAFKPDVWGLETILSRTMFGGRLGTYGGAGYNWLQPRFQAHFLEGTGTLDSTRIEVNLTRLALFAGAEWRARGRWSATAQVYAFPQDVALLRVGAVASVGGR